VARGISGNIFKNHESLWKFVDCRFEGTGYWRSLNAPGLKASDTGGFKRGEGDVYWQNEGGVIWQFFSFCGGGRGRPWGQRQAGRCRWLACSTWVRERKKKAGWAEWAKRPDGPASRWADWAES
jgi:hypothetical protein